MKTIKFLFISLLLVTFFSCDVETEDIVTQNAHEGFAQLRFTDASMGKILGTPADADDLVNSSVAFADVALNIELVKITATENAAKYEILKTFFRNEVQDEDGNVILDAINGEEFVVAESTDLPISLTYTSLDEFMAGTEITNADDLRIGDQYRFRTRVTGTDGSQYFIQDGGSTTGTYYVGVSCFSDLEGSYTNDAAPGCNGADPITVTEVAPGRYYVSSMTGYQWASGNCIGFYMVDSCGGLKYDGGDLEDNGYSGEGGEGVVNPDGSFTFTCKLNEVGYSETSTYVPL